MFWQAFVENGREHDCSFSKDQIERYINLDEISIPLHKMSLWRQYYIWMERDEKVQIIDGNISNI